MCRSALEEGNRHEAPGTSRKERRKRKRGEEFTTNDTKADTNRQEYLTTDYADCRGFQKAQVALILGRGWGRQKNI